MRLSGALQKKKSSELSYREIVKNSSNDETIAAKQVTWAAEGPIRSCLARAHAGLRREIHLGLWECAFVGLHGRANSPVARGHDPRGNLLSPGSFMGYRDLSKRPVCGRTQRRWGPH
jgi:hypothetical protein